ncbi:unnamed protein product, partial [Polarella glacialis]
ELRQQRERQVEQPKSKLIFVQWKDKGSSKSVKAESVRRLEGIKFKARGELLTFAARHPGALSGYFLAMIHQKLSAGRVTRGKQLREVSVSQWAAQHSGLTETRDLREVATLGAVMDCINMRDLSTAMDTLSQRIVAIQLAKTAGCDWKKAEALELVWYVEAHAVSALSQAWAKVWRELKESCNAVHAVSALFEVVLQRGGDFGSVLRHGLSCRRRSLSEHKAVQAVRDFVRGGLPSLQLSSVKEYLRHAEGYAGPSATTVLPLGAKAGVPTAAAEVDLASALKELYPEAAAQVAEPGRLLLPATQRPWKLKRPVVRIDATYPDFVRRCAKAGLQRLVKKGRVWKHRGRRLLTGGFAVPKDEFEDRAISAMVPLNQLVDQDKLVKPNLPSLVKYKRDARHYFHTLKLGRRWGKYMAHPPIRGEGGEDRFPLHVAAPMGFAASACWAQQLTDVSTTQAGLPEERRVRIDRPVPETFPVWGSVEDDVWAVAEVAEEGQQDRVCEEWMQALDLTWRDLNIEVNVKKNVNGEEAEIQGAVLHEREHWLGASRKRRGDALWAVLYVLSLRKVPVKVIERLGGKLSYIMMFAPHSRCLFQEVYAWLDWYRVRGVNYARLWPVVWTELLAAAFWMPLLEADLDSPWCDRLELSDAAPGGHGRAGARFPEGVIIDIARYADVRKVHTSLNTEFGIEVDAQYRCPLFRVEVPFSEHWNVAPRPGGHSHITLEEAAATICTEKKNKWAKQPNSFQDVQPVDLRRGVPERDRVLTFEMQPGIPFWQQRERIVLRTCSGPRRDGDFGHWLESLAWEQGYAVYVMCFDPCNERWMDLEREDVMVWLRELIATGCVVGDMNSPPCSMWSKARHRPLENGLGPRPAWNTLLTLDVNRIRDFKTTPAAAYPLAQVYVNYIKKHGGAFGERHGRIAMFLLSGLRASSERYQAAVASFSDELSQRGIPFQDLREEELDELVAERVIDFFEETVEGSGISKGSMLVAAVSKIKPRFRLTTSWKVLDVWRVRVPPVQALTFPPEFAFGLAVWMTLAKQHVCAAVVATCFSGLFRVSELLHLHWKDFFLSPKEAVMCLGQAKRGLEQKVVLTHQSMVKWLTNYVAFCKIQGWSRDDDDYVFPVSYGKVGYWMRKGMAALNLTGHWTTHGLRRGGATELLRQGMPVADIAIFGRWLSERSMREYLRRGEVSLMRMRGQIRRDDWRRTQVLAAMGPEVWN